MGVEAARRALAPIADRPPDSLWFSTAEPPYLEKTNANVIHAALRLPASTTAVDFGGAVKSGVGALRAALGGGGTTLLVQADIRGGLPTSTDESGGGDAAVALVVGDDADGPLAATYLGGASATEEFLDRWRQPGDPAARQWEERFGETRYVPLGQAAWSAGLQDAGVSAADVSLAIITGVHPRAQKQLVRGLGDVVVADDLGATIGNSGTAHPALLLTNAIEQGSPGDKIAVMMVADGVEVLVFEIGDGAMAAPSVAAQLGGEPIPYPKFLQWRGMLQVQPPNRPAPNRISAAAAARVGDWKHGFVASAGDESGLVHMPPARVSIRPEDTIDGETTVPMADAIGRVVTFTVDKLVYSVSPPVVFAVIDFDGGGRMPMELTDVEADEVEIGMQVVPTFRRLFTADGIHNYFWKARPA